MPAGQNRDREVERHDRVHRDDQRRRQPRQQQVGRPVAMPVPGRASPAHRQEPVDILRPAIAGPVPQRRQVGNQPHVPEEKRNGGVSRNREDVPDQRAAPLRPEPHRIRIRRQPVEKPRPAHVKQREKPRAGDGEERHRLGESVDRRPPVLLEQAARIAEISVPAWPIPIHQTKLTIAKPHITGTSIPQIPTPRSRSTVSDVNKHRRQEEADRHAQKPAPVVGPHQHERTDLVRHRGIRMPRRQDRHLRRACRPVQDRCDSSRALASISGLGLRSFAR